MKIFIHILLALFPVLSAMAENSWTPTPAWPFVLAEFQESVIHTASGKTVKAKANIHVGSLCLWYISNGKNLEAKKGIVDKVVFADGTKYIEAYGKLCKVIREDSINGKIHRLLCSTEVEQSQYEEMVRNQRAAERSSMLDIAGLNNMNLDMSVRGSASNADQEPLPIENRFYIQLGNDTFEAVESKILKHLKDNEERKAYRAYTRKAEIITGNLSSMLDVYTTFFTK